MGNMFEHTAKPDKSDAEIIDGAIDLVSRDEGWCQGAFCKTIDGDKLKPFEKREKTSTLAFCIEGAILESACQAYTSVYDAAKWNYGYELNHRINAVMKKELKNFTGMPRDFNDDKSTSQEDAILYLKQAREYFADAEQ